jgi:hypothetical protein
MKTATVNGIVSITPWARLVALQDKEHGLFVLATT